MLKTTPQRLFKYRINALLNETPGLIRDKVKSLAATMKLSVDMVNKIRFYKWGEQRSANTDQIWLMAQHFGVEPTDLMNPPPSKSDN